MPRVLAAALLLVLFALAGCRGGGVPVVRAERRVTLPGGAPAGAELRIDARGREWVVSPGQVLVIDTGRAAVPARITAPAGVPLRAPLTDPAGRLYAERSSAAFRALAAAAGVPPPRLREDAPLVRDPRSRWYYVGTRRGGVLGVSADSLRIRWGWPEDEGRVTALAVSPLGDRVYLARGPRSEEDDFAPRLDVLDAQTGRLLDSTALTLPARALFATEDGWVRGYGEEGARAEVFALAPGLRGIETRWRLSLRRLGLRPPAVLRASPSGSRLAVLATGSEGGGLRLLDGTTGAVIGRPKERPLDAAFDARGQLHLLYPNRTARLP